VIFLFSVMKFQKYIDIKIVRYNFSKIVQTKRAVLTLLIFILLLSAKHTFAESDQMPENPWSPPEYFPSKAVLLEWDFYEESWQLYSELIREIQSEAELILLVNNIEDENKFKNYLSDGDIDLENIRFVHIPSGRIWVRDHGPLSVWTDNGVAFMDFEDFANSGVSSALPMNLAQLWEIDCFQHGNLILDGGNFMVDSYNTLFATDRLYSNNSGSSTEYIDTLLKNYMGIDNIVTFQQMGSSDVWGHIDMQMKLLDDSTVVISSVEQGWPVHSILEENFEKFALLTSPFGTPYRIARLPKADNWKSYTNALIINNKVIIPQYDHPNDTIAVNTYQALMPHHQVVGINANAIVGWDGVIHCITMQLFDESQMETTETFTISVSIYPDNGGSVTGAGVYAENDTITLKAIAAAGFVFESWTESGTIIEISDSLNFLAEEDRHFTANFTQLTEIQAVKTPILTVYPNPASHYLGVNTEYSALVHIYNIRGQKVLSSKLDIIDIRALSSGIYFVKINESVIRIVKL
jgi:agmatine deiminase